MLTETCNSAANCTECMMAHPDCSWCIAKSATVSLFMSFTHKKMPEYVFERKIKTTKYGHAAILICCNKFVCIKYFVLYVCEY